MTSANPAMLTDEAGDPVFTDVWSRTASKYRKRAIVLLIVNILLFAGLGSFAYWLRTGVRFAPVQSDYGRIIADTFMPRGDANLGNFTLFPINLADVPVHGIVVGLLLAALVSVPILIAILYRFPCSLPFILIVAFLAVMPWLAINITGACMLASLRPFRFRFRYASALLGLVLVLLYFYGASRQSAPTVDPYTPAERIKFMAPWILATFASCLIMGLVLFLARVVDYRPGVVAPLLLVCFAIPVALFEWKVGRDALHYRLLEQHAADIFGERDGSAWFERITRDAWNQRAEPKPPLDVFRRQMDLRIALELSSARNMRTAFAQQKEDFTRECRHFVKHFPDSQYAPNALYLLGQALDARIDIDAFLQRKLITVYHDFPVRSERTELVWRKVVHNAPESSVSAVGRYKLALLAARAGRVARAVEWLDDLIARHEQPAPAAEPVADDPGVVKKALASAPPDASLKIAVDRVVFDARRLRSLLLENANDPLYAVRPLCGSRPNEPRQPGYLQFNPRESHYARNLRGLLAAYPGCLLADNITLWLALDMENPHERVRRLQACVDRYPAGDARPEALYQLGLACLEIEMDARGRRALADVTTEYPKNLWAQLAEKRLRALPPPEMETRS
jgi:hypothetical protein